jgi:DNA-binding XRE family transcriptional regulator
LIEIFQHGAIGHALILKQPGKFSAAQLGRRKGLVRFAKLVLGGLQSLGQSFNARSQATAYGLNQGTCLFHCRKGLFGQRLRAARVEIALTYKELADQADLHRTYIGQVERGERNISVDNMEKLAEAVGQDLWRMLQPEERVVKKPK